MLNVTRLIDSIPLNFKKDLEFISKEIHDSGKESFLIGGSVRDLILGKKPHEYDLTTSMLPEEIKKKFKRVIETGIQHGTVTIMLGDNAYEITTYRKDIDYTDGRRPDKIEFGASLSEDMKRRDFTMNAIALDLVTERLIDENHGIANQMAVFRLCLIFYFKICNSFIRWQGFNNFFFGKFRQSSVNRNPIPSILFRQMLHDIGMCNRFMCMIKNLQHFEPTASNLQISPM